MKASELEANFIPYYFALTVQLDFLRADYDNALETLEQQKKDIQKLLAMLIERDIPIPGGIIDRYIKRISDIDSDVPEELPFN